MMKFSVLMSVYAKESPLFLKEALESLRNQTLPAAEIVIVKDGPIGEALESVLTEYAGCLPLRTVGYEKNRGLGYALAFGLRQCQYDWVARMDADDIAVKDRFEKQIAYLEQHPEIGLLGSSTLEFDKSIDDAVRGRIVPCTHKKIIAYLKKRSAFNHMTVFFRKKDVLDAGNYRECSDFEDYYLWVRMALNGVLMANMPDPLVYARIGNDLIGRRIGIRYARHEYRFYKKIRKLGFLNCVEFVKIICIRIPLRLLPKSVLAFIYKKMLRNH